MACKQSEMKKYRVRLIKNHILCSCLLITFARFQNFLQERTELFCQVINSAGGKVGSLPPMLLFCHLRESLEDCQRPYIVSGDERRAAEQIHELVIKDGFQWLNPNHVPTLDPKKILSKVAYPKDKNIKLLGARIGIKDMIAEIDKKLGRSSMGILKTIGDLRVEMAHEGMPSMLSSTDISNMVKAIHDICRIVDKIFHNHELQTVSNLRHANRSPSRSAHRITI